MTIYYALVTRDNKTILSEYSDYSGNFQQTVRQLFPHIDLNKKKSFQANEYNFHCIDEDGITFICMTGEDTERKMAFAFLADLKKTFYNAFTSQQIQAARSYELEFAETISKKIKFFNENPIGFDTKTDEILSELQGVKDVMVENIE